MPTPRFEIREPVATDYPHWRPLWQGYLEFYESTLDERITATLWRRILDPAHEIQARVAALADGELAGLVHFFPHSHTWYEHPVCYLNDLFVSPEIRGGGLGAALIDAVVAEARRHGWAEVYWHTQHHNATARGLYDKLTGGTDGFVNYTIKLEVRD